MLVRPSFRVRRFVALFATALACGAVATIAWLERTRLGHASFFTGGTLFAALMLLMLLGVRRRLPVLPLGRCSVWTQVHLYTGLFAAVVYLMHVPAVVAGGVFESALSLTFLLVTASGLYGVFASRTLPKRLTAVEGQHRFDQVSWHRRQIARAAGDLLDELSEPASVTVLGGYYGSALKPFFAASPPLSYLIVPAGARRRNLIRGLTELTRYMGREGQQAAGRFAALVRRRDDLDYQFALQWRLRAWVWFHALTSIMLIAGAVVHAALAWRFAN